MYTVCMHIYISIVQHLFNSEPTSCRVQRCFVRHWKLCTAWWVGACSLPWYSEKYGTRVSFKPFWCFLMQILGKQETETTGLRASFVLKQFQDLPTSPRTSCIPKWVRWTMPSSPLSGLPNQKTTLCYKTHPLENKYCLRTSIEQQPSLSLHRSFDT